MKKTTQPVVRAVSGKLRRKIHRHDSDDLEERAPPMTGPMPFAIATTAPYKTISSVQNKVGVCEKLTKIPWYFPLSRKGTTSLTMSCATVIKPPPPMPVNARKMVNWSTDCESEDAKDPTKNIASPESKTTLRDQISESRPYSNCPTVDVLTE